MDSPTPYSFLRDLKVTMASEREKLTALKNQLAADDAYESIVICRELEKMIQEFKDRLEIFFNGGCPHQPFSIRQCFPLGKLHNRRC